MRSTLVARPPKGRFDFKRILAAVDDDPSSRHVISWARELALRFGSDVWVVEAVLPAWAFEEFSEWQENGVVGARLHRLYVDRANRRVTMTAERLAGLRGKVRTRVIQGFSGQALAAFAKRQGIDLVVMGSHRRGPIGRLLIGTIADYVKNHVAASLLVARSPAQLRRILIATDGSEAAQRAMDVGLRLAHLEKGQASVLHFSEVPLRGGRATQERQVQEAFERLGRYEGAQRPGLILKVGPPARGILATAKERNSDLIVLGSRGLSGLRGLALGSVSNRVAHKSRIAVIIVKRPGRGRRA